MKTDSQKRTLKRGFTQTFELQNGLIWRGDYFMYVCYSFRE